MMMCDYVPLKPVRAHLRRREERLLAYPWRSFGWYLALRSETTLPVRGMAARVNLGTPESAKAVLHRLALGKPVRCRESGTQLEFQSTV
jgi:hypothetical protein